MNWTRIGAIVMLLGAMLGAFGAHGLKRILMPEILGIYQTGVLYHLIHGLAILVVAALLSNAAPARADLINGTFLAGIIFFSGSLYLLAITGIRMFGAITPIGGVLFLVGWFLLAFRS